MYIMYAKTWKTHFYVYTYQKYLSFYTKDIRMSIEALFIIVESMIEPL